jgi:S1-C subfamily serine protease
MAGQMPMAGVLDDSPSDLFRRAAPSIVRISTLRVCACCGKEEHALAGSGVVWDDAGHIVTNAHVLNGPGPWEVVAKNGARMKSELVGRCAENDLAVLRVSARLKPLTLGTSDDLSVGQKAYALGHPLNLGWTFSQAMVSGLEREMAELKGLIQLDGPLFPGHSGGALLDASGRMIGLLTLSTEPSGIGLAIPAETLKRVLPKLIR